MTIRHLEIFIKVAECGKMRQAAEELFISQPSVSQAIKEIEDHYGVKLFERLSKKLFITEQGERLLKHATHIVKSFDQMEEEIFSMGQSLTLRIGGTVTVGSCLMPVVIKQFEQANPEIDTKIIIHNITEIHEQISNSTLDIGIVEGEVSGDDLTSIPICTDQLVLIASKNHPLVQKDKITLADLQGQDIIVREEGSSARIIFDHLLKEHHIAMNEKWYSTNTESIKNAVLAGQGVAVLSNLLLGNEIHSGSVRIIPIEDVLIQRNIYLVYHKNKFLSEPMLKFISAAKEVAKNFSVAK